MGQISEVISRLRAKIGIVINDNLRLAHRLAISEGKIKDLQREKEQLMTQLAQLNDRIKIFEMTGDFVNVSGGTKSARERINKLIREIDKCIALMNK